MYARGRDNEYVYLFFWDMRLTGCKEIWIITEYYTGLHRVKIHSSGHTLQDTYQKSIKPSLSHLVPSVPLKLTLTRQLSTLQLHSLSLSPLQRPRAPSSVPTLSSFPIRSSPRHSAPQAEMALQTWDGETWRWRDGARRTRSYNVGGCLV